MKYTKNIKCEIALAERCLEEDPASRKGIQEAVLALCRAVRMLNDNETETPRRTDRTPPWASYIRGENNPCSQQQNTK